VYYECVSEDDGLCVDTFICVHKEEIVDTTEQTLQVGVRRRKKRWRTIQERREIVEETLLPGASVSRVARRHDVNANQVFHWRKQYREGRLSSTTNLLAVQVASDQSVEAVREDEFTPRSGSLEIKLAKATVRIFGTVDVLTLRAVLESLVG
jgi:transposase